VLIGTLVGLPAGFVRGWLGSVLMRFTDLMMAFPALLLAIALAAIFQPSVWIVALVIAMVNWVQIARVIYSETVALAARDFVAVERTLGASARRILFSHLLPHLLPTILVWATLGISTTVLLEATLSFLGVGVQPPTPSWGNTSPRRPGWCSFPGRPSCCCRWPSTWWATHCATSSTRPCRGDADGSFHPAPPRLLAADPARRHPDHLPAAVHAAGRPGAANRRAQRDP